MTKYLINNLKNVTPTNVDHSNYRERGEQSLIDPKDYSSYKEDRDMDLHHD